MLNVCSKNCLSSRRITLFSGDVNFTQGFFLVVSEPLDKIFFCFIMESSGKKWSEVEHNRRIRCSWGNTTIP